MDNDAITRGQSGRRLGFLARLMAYPDDRASGAVLGESIYRPLFALTEQSARWDLQDVLHLPQDDADFDSIPIPDAARRGRVDEVKNHIDSLLFDTERGDL